MKQFVILFALVSFAFSAWAQPYAIELNLQKGKSYQQNTTTRIDIKQELMGQKIPMSVVTSAIIDFKVKGDKGGSYLIDAQYKDMRFEMDVMGNSMLFDAKNADDEFSRLLKNMTEKKFDIEMSKSGKVLAVNNIDRLFEDFENMHQQGKLIAEQLKQSYGEEAFKGNIELTTAILPDRKVKIGDTWIIETTLQSTMSALQKVKYTLIEVKNGQYIIEGKGSIKSVNPENLAKVEAIYDMQGTSDSRFIIDQKSAWVKSAELVQEMDGTAQVKLEMMTERIPMKMQFKSVTTIK